MVVTSAKGKDVGTKRACASCGTKFYDFKRPEPKCPKCGAIFDVSAVVAPTKVEPPTPAPDDEEIRRSRLLAGLDDEELEIAGKVEDDDDVDFSDGDDDDDDAEGFEDEDGGGGGGGGGGGSKGKTRGRADDDDDDGSDDW